MRRPEPRSEGEHLSDYEPSEVGVDELPAISAVRRHQKPGALVLFQIVSHSGSHFTNVAMSQVFVWFQYLATKLISLIPPSLINSSVRCQLFRVVAFVVLFSATVGVSGNLATVIGRHIERS